MAAGSAAEDLFIELFSDTFGADKLQYLYSQYPFFDIYNNSRFADFVIENGGKRIAFEIDGERDHNPAVISRGKYIDDLLRQNSMIHMGWDVYRWVYNQLREQPDTVKDEMRLFMGDHPLFRMIQDYLPRQRGQVLELKEHQLEAYAALNMMRENHQTIALITHPTGTGKTVTAISDAKAYGKRTLFVAHTHELVMQAYRQFHKLWPEKPSGLFLEGIKQYDTYVLCGSVQSVALNLDSFNPRDFAYLIIDEAHHATAESYQKILAYFQPEFTLGLTATPERTDGENLLAVFQNLAHKLDLATAVEIGELVPVRCIRIHTNIDISKVRMNGIKYNIRELETKLFVPERNLLIVNTWLNYVKNKRTVVFCASVRHAEEIAGHFRTKNIRAEAVSGSMKGSQRKEILGHYENGDITVLCACDLLNEGWDSPKTEALFMARPTMSKVLYTQQLGRGMRTSPGKDYLMVFDFVDNANIYNAPYSLHRLLNLKNYRAGELLLAPRQQQLRESEIYASGEKPEALIDYPITAIDYELVDIFNWQEEAAGMISQLEFVRRVDVQSETIDRYVREGKILPDLSVPLSDKRSFKYFKPETVEKYAREFGWTLIDDNNRKDLFLQMVERMDMSYSYKPVMLKAFLECVNDKGRADLGAIVKAFKNHYENRKQAGLAAEKANSIMQKGGYTDKDVEQLILRNPFARFEEMQILRHAKSLGTIEMDSSIYRKLSAGDKAEIIAHCQRKIEQYYGRMGLG